MIRNIKFDIPIFPILVISIILSTASWVNAQEAAVIEMPSIPQVEPVEAVIQEMQNIKTDIVETLGADEVIEPAQPIEAGGGNGADTSLDSDDSVIEMYISGKISPEISTNIKQFGYDLFNKAPTTFAPSNKTPIGPDYIIGPGDQIIIKVWGKFEGRWQLVVDRDGNITIPKLGVLHVTGLTFAELKQDINMQFSQYYTGFELNISMGALRSIQVYIVGNAKRPGAYTISSLSTIVNALFLSGGPAKTGSMRNIILKRNGEDIVHFDMYDLLLKGDKSKDARIMPEDVIFIPSIGPIAGVAGNVNRPAIYELKGETRISDLLEMAGGVTSTGYLKKIQLERVFDNEIKIILDKNLTNMEDPETDIMAQDGDLVKIFPISSSVINAISLEGNVVRPGKYQWEEGIRVSDIIKDTEKDLLAETYFDHALIERYVEPDFHQELVSFNLGEALFAPDSDENKVLQPYDSITIYSRWEFKEKPVVRIAGAVNKPGEYGLFPGMKISDLIKQAGGIKRYAYTEKAELTRVTITNDGPQTIKILLNLGDIIDQRPLEDLELMEDDYLFVRTVPEWDLYRTVSITGEVKFPGVYTVEKGERLSSLISRAGGFSDVAYLRGAIFTRESVKTSQQANINKMIDRLEFELSGASSFEASSAVTSDEAMANRLETDQKQKFLDSLKKIEAQGRVTISLAPPEYLKGSIYDLVLEEGDDIQIPKDPEMISVVGSVYNQNAFLYKEGSRAEEFISMAGGYTTNADKKNVYILKANGIAFKPGDKGYKVLMWNDNNLQWEYEYYRLESGDTIIVPEQLDKVDWMDDTKDLAGFIYQIAVSAGVLLRIF